jgi:ABC-type oligopeptide transport system ATPase subunit
VMEQGVIVERGIVEEIFDRPQQDYTKKLLSSIPSLDPVHRKIRAAEAAGV